MPYQKGISKPKTRRGKKFLDNRLPKITENDKTALIVKGGKTSQTVTSVLHELHALKKPLAEHLKRDNPFHPFEDDTGLEKFSQKHDASLFVFGSHSKKRPNTLIFGRMFDYHVLDMAEMHIENYVPARDFKTPKPTLGSKPCLVLQGTAFESDDTMKRIGNLMVDWLRGPTVNRIRLQGLEVVISLTAVENRILFRVYGTQLKKSGTKMPRVELVEIGPRIDFVVDRKKLASEDLFRTALKKPKQLQAKMRKNTSHDVFGTKLARIHVGKQKVDNIQTRKVKALRPNRPQHQERDEE
ncbi:brix domain-containing protein 1 [Aphelenchoides avenae]|nr:brix domain-containing protein 1 [Aphelenchus avenae]